MTPRFFATSSPPDMAFISTALRSSNMKPTRTIGKIKTILLHVAPHIPPISQLTNSRRASSSETYFAKDTPAWKRYPTTTPESINTDFDAILFLDIIRTKIILSIPNTNANNIVISVCAEKEMPMNSTTP